MPEIATLENLLSLPVAAKPARRSSSILEEYFTEIQYQSFANENVSRATLKPAKVLQPVNSNSQQVTLVEHHRKVALDYTLSLY